MEGHGEYGGPRLSGWGHHQHPLVGGHIQGHPDVEETRSHRGTRSCYVATPETQVPPTQSHPHTVSPPSRRAVTAIRPVMLSESHRSPKTGAHRVTPPSAESLHPLLGRACSELESRGPSWEPGPLATVLASVTLCEPGCGEAGAWGPVLLAGSTGIFNALFLKLSTAQTRAAAGRGRASMPPASRATLGGVFGLPSQRGGETEAQ